MGDPIAGIIDGYSPARDAGLRVRRADLSRVRPIRWAWQGRIPIGYLSLLLGAEGIGKSTFICWMLARATRGELPGDLHGEPTRVLIVGDEDSFDSVIVPRLHAAGADLGLVDTLSEEGDPLDLDRDSYALRELVGQGGYKVVFFDALLDTLGVDVDDWRSKSVRAALRPLRRAARDLDFAALGALHPNKGQRTSFRDLISGTHAFNASSRSSLLLAAHPSDANRRVLVRGKGNLAAVPPSIEFEINGRDMKINGHEFSLPVVEQVEEGSATVEELLSPQREAPVRDTLAEQIDRIGTGEVQTRAEIARALGRDPSDRSVGRALEQLEDEGRWLKRARGKWQRIGIGTSKEVPMSKSAGPAVSKSRRAA